MFINFFNNLKKFGLDVTLKEWLTLQEALDKDLAGSSLTRFYYLARMILVKSETEYDKFDMAFENTFKSAKYEPDITDTMLAWLDKPDAYEQWLEEKKHEMNSDPGDNAQIDRDDVEKKFRDRLKEQDSEHNGGSYWIGTQGKTSFGNMGGHMGGIRVGGQTGYQSAFEVIGARKYQDFRDDKVLTSRQFMAALKSLRQFSTKLDVPKTELDIDGTVYKTCNNGGYLQIVMDKPRKNSVKLLLLMDSGGTMIPYSSLLNELFQAVDKMDHFKDVKTYYFHNCVYAKVYNTPECENGDWIDTDWLFKNLDSDYKVILVGDAAMAPEELYSTTGNYRGPNNGLSGWDWLHLIKSHYKHVVWLNPKMAPGDAPWREAETAIKTIFPMYKLTVAGLKAGVSKLMVNR